MDRWDETDYISNQPSSTVTTPTPKCSCKIVTKTGNDNLFNISDNFKYIGII